MENTNIVVSQRFKSFLEHVGMNIPELSKKLGYSRCDKLYNIVNGKYLPSFEILQDITKNFVGFNANWMLTGEGDMMLSNKKENYTNNNCNIRKAEYGERGIPLVPLHAMAGMLVGEQQVMEYECERYVVPAFQDADFLITVKGNSMSPTYTSGDLVACKRLNLGSVFFQWNKTYVIDTDQGALIKRIQPGHDKQHITIVSDNSDYAPFELETEHIYAVALVVGMIRME